MGLTNNTLKKPFVVLEKSSVHSITKITLHDDEDGNEEDLEELGDYCEISEEESEDLTGRASHVSSDDDSTIDGSTWGIDASEDDIDDDEEDEGDAECPFVIDIPFRGKSDNCSMLSSTNNSLAFNDASSCLSYDDYYDAGNNRVGEEKNDVEHRHRVNPSSRFYSVPSRRMSVGEMETVMETVFRSFNSLSQSLTKNPSERRLSFAAAMVEKQLFDKSAPACETARGCLNRMESWAKRTDEDCTSVPEEGDADVAQVLMSNVPTSVTTSKPKKLKSILKIFPRFSKPRATTIADIQHPSGCRTVVGICGSGNGENTPPSSRGFQRSSSSFFGKSKTGNQCETLSPVRPKRQMSLRSLFDSNHDNSNNNNCSSKDKKRGEEGNNCIASPPQRPRRQVSLRNLFQNNSSQQENDAPMACPSRKLSRQGSGFFGLARTAR